MIHYRIKTLAIIFGVAFASQSYAQGVTTGTYKTNTNAGCGTLVLTGAGPEGNKYSFDEGCNGSDNYEASSVTVTSRGISIDGARVTNIEPGPKGFIGDWTLRGQTRKGVAFNRQ